MGETTPRSERTAPAAGEGETDHTEHEVDVETSALHPSPHATRFRHAERFGDTGLRRIVIGAVLVGLAALLAVVTPLQQSVWRLVAPLPSATATIRAKYSPTEAPTSTWDALHARRLHYPTLASGAPCPISPAHTFSPAFGLGLGSGAVHPFGFTPDSQPAAYASPHQTSSGVVPGLTELGWAVAPTYGGAVLVHGAQLDGSHPVAFKGGYVQRGYQGDWAEAPQLTELRLIGYPNEGRAWTLYGSYIRLGAPGCYAFQLDGADFTDILIFQAGV